MNWPIVTIGEICDLKTGGTPSKTKKEYFEGGDIRWLVSGDIHKKSIYDCEGRITEEGLLSSSAKYLPMNSIMIALNGQGKTRGTVALLKCEATCNQSLVSIMPQDTSVLLPEYLFAYLHGRYQQIRKMTGDSGNDRRGLNMPLIRKIQFPLAPLPEQKRIVAILDKAFEGIDTAIANTEKNLANARELFESYLENLFNNNEWKIKSLESFSRIINGFAFKSGDFSSNEGIKAIKITNVGVYEFVHDDKNNLPHEHMKKYSSYRAFEGDVVIALTRTIISTGLKVAVVPACYDGALVNQRVAAVQVDENVLPKKILQAFLSTKTAINYVKSNVNELMQPNLSIKDLKSFPIPIPPNAEIESILNEITNIKENTNQLKKTYQHKLTALSELKQSILNKAFSGELTTIKDDELRTEEVA